MPTYFTATFEIYLGVVGYKQNSPTPIVSNRIMEYRRGKD